MIQSSAGERDRAIRDSLLANDMETLGLACIRPVAFGKRRSSSVV